MLEHRAAVQQQLVQQEAEGLRRLSLDREQVLGRLWEIANMSPEMTRNSITGQIKALSLIIAMQNLIPDPKAISEKKSPVPVHPQTYAPAQQEGCPGVPEPAPRSMEEAPPNGHSTFASNFSPSEPQPPSPFVPIPASIPDLRVPFSIKNNPFVHRR
jgi:hypothetical protein